MGFSSRWIGLVMLGLLALRQGAQAQVPAAPPPPERYKATLRYEIVAARDIHVERFDALLDHLERLGFVFDIPREKMDPTDREDPGKNTLKGILPSKSLAKVLKNSAVASLLLIPEKIDLPAEGDALVRVRLEIAGGLAPSRQLELVEQVRALLSEMGAVDSKDPDGKKKVRFREAFGYDHRGFTGQPFTRLVGDMPRAHVETLVRDLRNFPFGWFGPEILPENLPAPLSARHPILITEVLSTAEVVRPYDFEKEVVPPEVLSKIDQELWKKHQKRILGGDKGEKDEALVRVEIFLASPPSSADPNPVGALRKAAPSLFLEGQVGQMVVGVLDPGELGLLASLPNVLLVRLPRLPHGPIHPDVSVEDARKEMLRSTGLAALHAREKKGKGVRLAVIDRDFRGWQEMLDAGKLPAGTRMIDLTRQYDFDVRPVEGGGKPGDLGHGTLCALAAAFAAPEAEVLLVRILGLSAHELTEVGRYFQGDTDTSTLVALRDALTLTEKDLLSRRAALLAERKVILEFFKDDRDEKVDFGYLGPVFGWVFSERSWLHDRMEYHENLEKELGERFERFQALVADIVSLRGTHVALCSLNWPTGYPLGGTGPVVRWFDERGVKGPLWFQAAGNTRGQAWSGKFRDEDGNGILEFADAKTPLKPGRWTRELAFLRWEPWGKLEKPEKAPVRVTLQWREAHDPEYFLNPVAAREEERDPFARPQARIDVLLLRQVDPEGKTVGADVFELVARNAAAAARLEFQPGTAVYETSFTAELDLKSHYVLRVISPANRGWRLQEVEGDWRYYPFPRGNSRTTRPSFAPSLPALDKTWELEPRIFIETLGPEGLMGRVVFADFYTDAGTLGVPAEARGIWTVGAVEERGKKRPYSAEGPPAFSGLRMGPVLYAPDALQLGEAGHGGAFGTSVAASLTAGWVAAVGSETFQRERMLLWLGSVRGKRISGEK